MKRTTALILALLMCVSMMPNVFAFTPEAVESAAETVPGSESAALAVSNDPAVLGDNYLVDGLGKALLYVSGATMTYDFLDSTYITGHTIYDDGVRDIQYFEAGSSASLASDPKDAGKTVTKLVAGGQYAFGALYFEPGQFNFQKGKYTGRADMFLDPASYNTATYAFLCRTQVYKGTENGSDSNSGLDLTLLKNGEWVTCTSATGTYDGSKYNYNYAMEGESIRFLAFGINGPQGTTSYLRNMYYYFYPANSFMIKGTDGKLQLVELSEGDIYTFPAADGDYVCGFEVYQAGDKMAVSELEYKTFTVGGELNLDKTPGINIATGNQNPLTFDEEPALKWLTGGATNSITTFDVEGVTGNENGKKAFKVSVPKDQHYMSVFYEKFIEAYRPYFVKFDVYSNHSPENACLWLIDGNTGNGGDHVSLQNGFTAAIQGNKWYTAAATARYSADRTNIQIQTDTWWGNPSAGHEGTYYYYDNLSIVPYYKVSYIYNGAIVGTAYVNSCENDGTFRTELPLDLTKTLSIDGKKHVGWSLKQNSTVADAPEAVAAANRDIKLYAVVKDVGVTSVTFMNGEAEVASKSATVGAALPLVLVQNERKSFLGWSTDGTKENILTTVPETNTVLHAVFEDVAATGDYGKLLYYTDFSSEVYEDKPQWDNNGESNQFADSNYDPDGNGTLSTRTWFATYENAYDPAGSGNPVLKVNKKNDNSRPTIKFSAPLANTGFYTITGKVFVPKGQSGACRLLAYADTQTDSGTGPDIWKYALGNDWSKWDALKINYTEGEWKEFSRTYRVPEDIPSIGQIGIINSLNNTQSTYYIDDLAVWYQPVKAPTASNDVSVRVDSVTGIRFSASVSASLKASALEYGFIVTRKSILDTIGKTANDLKFDLTAEGYETSKLYASGVAYQKDDEGNVLVDKQYDVDTSGNVTYTAVCTGIPKVAYSDSIISRPYIRIAMHGKVVTSYGKAVTSSMKEAAQSVKDAGGPAYEDNKEAIEGILGA